MPPKVGSVGRRHRRMLRNRFQAACPLRSTASSDAVLVEHLRVERRRRSRRVGHVEHPVSMSAGSSKRSCSHGMHSIIGRRRMAGAEVLVDAHHVGVMGHDRDVVGERDLGDGQPLGDAAEPRDVGLDVADDPPLDEVAERRPRVHVLAERDRDRRRVARAARGPRRRRGRAAPRARRCRTARSAAPSVIAVVRSQRWLTSIIRSIWSRAPRAPPRRGARPRGGPACRPSSSRRRSPRRRATSSRRRAALRSKFSHPPSVLYERHAAVLCPPTSFQSGTPNAFALRSHSAMSTAASAICVMPVRPTQWASDQ